MKSIFLKKYFKKIKKKKKKKKKILILPLKEVSSPVHTCFRINCLLHS